MGKIELGLYPVFNIKNPLTNTPVGIYEVFAKEPFLIGKKLVKSGERIFLSNFCEDIENSFSQTYAPNSIFFDSTSHNMNLPKNYNFIFVSSELSGITIEEKISDEEKEINGMFVGAKINNTHFKNIQTIRINNSTIKNSVLVGKVEILTESEISNVYLCDVLISSKEKIEYGKSLTHYSNKFAVYPICRQKICQKDDIVFEKQNLLLDFCHKSDLFVGMEYGRLCLVITDNNNSCDFTKIFVKHLSEPFLSVFKDITIPTKKEIEMLVNYLLIPGNIEKEARKTSNFLLSCANFLATIKLLSKDNDCRYSNENISNIISNSTMDLKTGKIIEFKKPFTNNSSKDFFGKDEKYLYFPEELTF